MVQSIQIQEMKQDALKSAASQMWKVILEFYHDISQAKFYLPLSTVSSPKNKMEKWFCNGSNHEERQFDSQPLFVYFGGTIIMVAVLERNNTERTERRFCSKHYS